MRVHEPNPNLLAVTPPNEFFRTGVATLIRPTPVPVHVLNRRHHDQ